MIVIDTSVVVALQNTRDDDHPPVAGWFSTVREPVVTTPLAVAEMDYLLCRVGGHEATSALREDLAGDLEVAWWRDAMKETLTVAERYGYLDLGLTDASLVALAAHLQTTRLATLDERHFRQMRPSTGEMAFTLLPADA